MGGESCHLNTSGDEERNRNIGEAREKKKISPLRRSLSIDSFISAQLRREEKISFGKMGFTAAIKFTVELLVLIVLLSLETQPRLCFGFFFVFFF